VTDADSESRRLISPVSSFARSLLEHLAMVAALALDVA
jgi:hypothetical protein